MSEPTTTYEQDYDRLVSWLKSLPEGSTLESRDHTFIILVKGVALVLIDGVWTHSTVEKLATATAEWPWRMVDHTIHAERGVIPVPYGAGSQLSKDPVGIKAMQKLLNRMRNKDRRKSKHKPRLRLVK